MDSVVSNNLSLLVRALELNLPKGLRPWVIFPNSVVKGYLYDALAREGRPLAFEPFYLDELLTLIGVGKKRMSRERKQWRLEQLLREEGSFDELSEEVRREQIERQAKKIAHRFGEVEEFGGSLDEREQQLWDALFLSERYGPLSQLTAELPEGISLHAFGFSLLPVSWKKILQKLKATLYLLAPSSHYLGDSGLLGRWSSLCRHTLEDLDPSPLILLPESMATEPLYAPLVLPDMGLIKGGAKSRLAYLKADIALGREGFIDLPLDESVTATSAGDEPVYVAQLVRKALERGALAKEIAVFTPRVEPFAAALRRQGIPFTLLGSSRFIEEAKLVALRLPLGTCQKADLEQLATLLFPKGELLSWLHRVAGGKEDLFFQVKKWAGEVLASGAFMSFERLGEELASFIALIERAYSLYDKEPRSLAEWIELFDISVEQPFALDVDIAIDYSSAVAYLEEAFVQVKGAPSFNQDLVRLSPLDHRFVLPTKCTVVAGMTEEAVDEERAGLALLHIIGQTSDQIAFTCDEIPGPLLDDFLEHFPIELEQAPALPKEGGVATFDFFTSWHKPKLEGVEPTPCRTSSARFALADPIGWFMQKRREEVAADPLIPTPLEQAISVRSAALGEPHEVEQKAPFAKAAWDLAKRDIEEKQALISSLGERKRLIFSRNISRKIDRGEDHFFPATWLEGAVSNYTDEGLIVFGRDEARVRARHLPDLALLDSIGRAPRLYFIDLGKSVEYNGPFSTQAVAHFVALAKVQPAPLMPEALEALLAGDAARFSKVLGRDDVDELIAVWQPIARGLYGAL